MSQIFASGGQSIGTSASASVLPMNIQDWSPLGWTGWISLQSKELSRVFSNTTVQKHQFFKAQLYLQSNSHPHMTTGKTITLTRRIFVGKVTSLLFNKLSRLVMAAAVVSVPASLKWWNCCLWRKGSYKETMGMLYINVIQLWKVKVLVAPLCSALWDPLDCSPPGSSIHGILQARTLEWVAIAFSRDLPDPGTKPGSPALQADHLHHQGSPCTYFCAHVAVCIHKSLPSGASLPPSHPPSPRSSQNTELSS